MNDGRLDGKVAIVTGSTSGIGEGIARLFAKEGAKVAVSGRRTEKGENIRDEIVSAGGEACYIRADMTNDGDITNLINTTLSTYGQIDILVNNAGTFLHKAFIDVTSEEWDHFIALDAKSYFLAMQAVLPHMEKRGTGNIINITSQFAKKAEAEFSIYAFVKAGMTHLTRVVALEYADKGIRINSLLPGPVITEMTKDQPDSEHMRKQVPMGRFSTPEEMAKTALYFASDDSAFTTGASLIVDGGWYPC